MWCCRVFRQIIGLLVLVPGFEPGSTDRESVMMDRTTPHERRIREWTSLFQNVANNTHYNRALSLSLSPPMPFFICEWSLIALWLLEKGELQMWDTGRGQNHAESSQYLLCVPQKRFHDQRIIARLSIILAFRIELILGNLSRVKQSLLKSVLKVGKGYMIVSSHQCQPEQRWSDVSNKTS